MRPRSAGLRRFLSNLTVFPVVPAPAMHALFRSQLLPQVAQPPAWCVEAASPSSGPAFGVLCRSTTIEEEDVVNEEGAGGGGGGGRSGGGGGISGWRAGASVGRADGDSRARTERLGRLGRLGSTWHYLLPMPSRAHPCRTGCARVIPTRTTTTHASSRSRAVRVLLGAVAHVPGDTLKIWYS